ncbi:MAG: DUF1641 domain-containing protein [Actinomycetota bacterium]
MTSNGVAIDDPMDQVVERLHDPKVAAALVMVLDHAESLAVLAAGADGLLRRGETIAETIGDELQELRTANAGSSPLGDVDVAALTRLGGSVTAAGPALEQLVASDMLRSDVIDVLAMAADAAVDGRDRAAAGGSDPGGALALLRSLKDPEVQRGLAFVLEFARSLGRRMGA